jgi:hypothetical protein
LPLKEPTDENCELKGGIMCRKQDRVLAAGMAAFLLWSQLVPAQTPVAPVQTSLQNSADEAVEVEPKFIWGILIKFIAGQAFSAFTSWVGNKISEGVSNSLDSGSHALASGAGTLVGGGVSLVTLAIQKLRAKKDTRGGAFIAPNPTSIEIASKDAAPNTMGAPSTPLAVGRDGSPNFQGVNVAVVGIGADGNIDSFRAIKEGFRTGQRFKLHVLATFGGPLVIENINPRGERKQIYPPEKDSVIMLQPGSETLLPLGSDEYFQFANATGDEQLVLTLRDVRAVGAATSKAVVYRKDEDYGSNFVQEVTGTTFPAISEAIHLQHN